jgi:hypothetical protein
MSSGPISEANLPKIHNPKYSVFYCPACATISKGVDACPKCYYPLEITRGGTVLKYEDIADEKVKPKASEIDKAIKNLQHRTHFKCLGCNTSLVSIQGCPRCLYPLHIERDGKRVDYKDIQKKVIVPTELEIRLGIKNKADKFSYIRQGKYVADNNGNIVFERYPKVKSETEKLRDEVAGLRADLKAKEKAEKDKKRNIPWFLAGYFGSKAINEFKKKK